MIARNSIKHLVALLIFLLPVAMNASDANQKHNEKPEEFNATEMIMHHIADSHEWHFFGNTTLPLPVILKTDSGIVTFMSSEFHHDNTGSHVVTKNGQNFVKLHEKIYQLNSGETALSLNEKHEVTNAVKPLDLSITKNVFAMFITVALMLMLFLPMAKSYKKNTQAPKGMSNLLETFVMFIRDDIARPNIGEKKYMKFMPFLLTVFFFIWITNMLGLVPGGANVTGNISITVALGCVTLFLILINANKDYWKHVLWMPGVPTFVKPILAVVELLGVFIKPIALMIRLFANITAGHIIILSLLGLIFILKNAGIAGVSVPFALFISVLELLVAFLQAFIFTMLSALFIGMAVEEHEHH
ncbi:F0F1 ATP synthase subunit A [Flavobacterium sp. '19STA2R22 D10 B1']|uniref:F0F1 ATP synthase subunit A n=1 Tax=Flavobacterium aerium TaxID=3037261 RepID=UPI00278BD8C2|nr:F0F1 ATP synthase subunit A [Flavobacterium sp. '19STA2R22 D10 B1']